MTEEIIINGVDVAGCCKCYNVEQKILCGASGVCANNPNCYYKQLKRLEHEHNTICYNLGLLEQENKELKNKNICRETCEYFKRICNENTLLINYRSALDTIQRMILSAWEQGKYLDGGLYNDLINEFTKINEVLGNESK